ncbi:MAG: cytochrome b/b6 domain-containing protein [Candidatus Competibacterales bacterium]|nr:cytochrome b/b6 domain-containing protein [Candidatus Competibacterales bacterium]
MMNGEIKVWDPAVRVFHWLLVVGFFAAYFTEDELQDLHVWAGYLVFGLIVFRLLWGLIGTRHARFGDFVRGPATVLRYLGLVLTLRAPRHLGHNPAGGAMILILLLMLMVATVSGMALYGGDAWAGPLAGVMRGVDEEIVEALEEIHELSANFTVVLVVFHVLGVLWESLLHHENLVKAMFTGRKRA